MSITILNQQEELNSFPLTQSIHLFSLNELEESLFKENIVLFRLQGENKLISLSEDYSYNIGHIKQTYDIIPMTFKSEVYNNGYKITCDPVSPLNVDSVFCLYIDSNLSDKIINVTKSNSKSDSNIKVSYTDINKQTVTYVLSVKETSKLVNNKNITTFIINEREVLLDLKTNNIIKNDSLLIELQDTIYVKDETFNIVIKPNTSLIEANQTIIKTAKSSSIKPIEQEDKSTFLTNNDILNYYTKLNSKNVQKVTKLIPKYLDVNVFSVKIPDGYVLDTSTDVKYSLTNAFNNYLLKNLNLYDSQSKYLCTVYLDDFENELVFELTYSEDKEQIDNIKFDMSNIV